MSTRLLKISYMHVHVFIYSVYIAD